MSWKLLPLVACLASPALAQSSACVRDAGGALICGVHRPTAAPRPVAPSRAVPRNNLSTDAVRKSEALAQQRRDALDRQRRAAEDERTRLRRECLARTAPDGKASCGL